MGVRAIINARAPRYPGGNGSGIEESGVTNRYKTPKYIVSCFEILNEANTHMVSVHQVYHYNLLLSRDYF